MSRQPVEVSVIVPVHDAADYLRQCCASVLEQSRARLELVLVDDGSTDGSSAICDEMARVDARVRVIHQKNRGHAVAREVGVRAARGELVMWVDADDWIDPRWVDAFVSALRDADADLVVAGTRPATLGPVEALRDFLLARIEHTLWVSCARRELYEGIGFERVTIGEDVLMLERLVWRARRTRVIRRPAGYHYREVPTSVSRAPRVGNKADWPLRARLEVDFAREACPGLVPCARFDVMRGAGIVYGALRAMEVPPCDRGAARRLSARLRALMEEGLRHLPWRWMRARELRQVLRTLRLLR